MNHSAVLGGAESAANLHVQNLDAKKMVSSHVAQDELFDYLAYNGVKNQKAK